MGARSKRAIGGQYAVYLKRLLRIALLLIIIFLGWLIWRSTVTFLEQGSATIRERLSQALTRQVSLERISVGFPNRLSLHSFAILEQDGREAFFQCERLDLKAGWPLLAGQVVIREISLHAPTLRVYRTAPGAFNFGDGGTPSKIFAHLRLKQTAGAKPYNPLHWPVSVEPSKVSVTGGNFHLEDETEELPQLDGIFDITVIRQANGNTRYPESARVSIRDARFFHKGLQGSVNGTVEFSKNLASPDLTLLLPDSNTLQIQGAVRDYLHEPACRLRFLADQFDLRSLEPLRFPVLAPNSTISVSGDVRFNRPRLNKARLDSLTGRLSYSSGSMALEGISIKLPEGKGEITANINLDTATAPSPDAPKALPRVFGRAVFSYGGQPLDSHPIRKGLEKLIGAPFTVPLNRLAIELSIDSQQNGLTVSTAKLDAADGNLLLEGILEPFSGRLHMKGNFLFPEKMVLGYQDTVNQTSGKVGKKRGMFVLPVQISGSLQDPHVILTGVTPGAH